METKAQNQENNKEFPYCIEKEMEYQLKEKKVSLIEKRMAKVKELNTVFAGTLHIDYWDCAYPGTDELFELMFEEDEDSIYDLLDYIDFEDESPIFN